MNSEQVKRYGESLYFLYAELIQANQGYVHDPEAHNLCSAVCETDGKVFEFLSYSNPSGLAVNVKRYVQGGLIPEQKIHNALINRGGMQDLHTEVRLINYLNDQGFLGKTGTVSFFSTRSVCKTCAEAIAAAQRKCAGTTGFMSFELKAEDKSSDLSQVYAFVAQQGSLGAVRDTTATQGVVPMDLWRDARLFTRLDRNGDGHLTAEDGGRRGGGRLTKATSMLDRDGDGRVSREAFLSGPRLVFQNADTNRDGVVDAGELAAFRARTTR